MFLYNFFKSIFGSKCYKPEDQSGEIVVSGVGDIEIKLHKSVEYNDVCVDFVDDYSIVPCNPHHHDHLHWNIVKKHKYGKKYEYVLIIYWKVRSIRTIEWAVHY
jgi:hypothetical protein